MRTGDDTHDGSQTASSRPDKIPRRRREPNNRFSGTYREAKCAASWLMVIVLCASVDGKIICVCCVESAWWICRWTFRSIEIGFQKRRQCVKSLLQVGKIYLKVVDVQGYSSRLAFKDLTDRDRGISESILKL
jgi:hypothetical protein